MLKRNTSDSFPGADFVAADPVSSADCCKQQSVVLLIAQLRILGVPFIMRGGRLWFDQSDAAQLTMCKGPDPLPTGGNPDPLLEGQAADVTGSDFGAAEGTIWVGDASTYATSSVKVEQTLIAWTDTDVDFTVVKGALPGDPTQVWVFVENACGRMSSLGRATTIVTP